MQNDDKNLENIFLEIIQGFSSTTFSETPVFVKHSDLKDMALLRREYDRYLNKAKKMGLMTEEELLKFLDEQNT